MFYVWFDDLNIWRMRVFSAAGRTRAPAGPGVAVGSPPADA
jgi:hypothetical protein